MKCPACNNELVEYKPGNFKADICRDGCAGIWLDDTELEKCNEYNEAFSPELLRVKKNADVVIDRNKARSCPRCETEKLSRVMLDRDRNFEIDQCPKCHGHWLDIGELEKIRSDNKADTELKARMAAFENKVAEDMKDPAKRKKVQAFVQLLFK